MRRTQLYRQMPWIGGINTSVDPGVMNPQELVAADNVKFSTTGARIKRDALQYIDPAVPLPDFRSSSGTTRTLKWTATPLVNITSLNERLVKGEYITVTGNSNYNATSMPILSRTEIPEISSVVCIADVSGSLAGKYFLIGAGDSGANYYVWFKVSGVGVDPAISGRTGIEVDFSTNATATTVGAAIAAVLDPMADFVSSSSSGTVTITNALGGLTTSGAAGTSGFAFTVTTKGGHSVTYTAGSSVTESLTAATGITVARASAIISSTDYWRFTTDSSETQLEIFATDNFQLFSLDGAGRRVQIKGQGQVSSIICTPASTLTTGNYFLLNSANNATPYYVWYNKASGGGDPAISGRTGIQVAIGSGDSAVTVATKTVNAINAVADFTSVAGTGILVMTNTMTITCPAGTAITGGTHKLLDTIDGSESWYTWYNKKFMYYVWYNKASGGGNPSFVGRTGIQVNVGNSDTLATVTSAVATAITAASANFTVSSDTVAGTVTVIANGITQVFQCKAASAITTGDSFLITFTGDTLNPLIAGRVGIEVPVLETDSSTTVAASLAAAITAVTSDLIATASSAVVTVTTPPAGYTQVIPNGTDFTSGDYFILNSIDDSARYYIWFNVDNGGNKPTVDNRTAIEVGISATNTGATIVTAIASAVGAVDSQFNITSSSSVVQITNTAAGATDPTIPGTTNFTCVTNTQGATNPITKLTTIRTQVFNERIIIFFSGLGNLPIIYNPDDNTQYQLLAAGNCPDAEFGFLFQGRLWTNDKTNRGLLNFCETANETKWLGIGDSGGLPIQPGDGDPEGINNGYVYKGILMVGKKTKRYRVTGDSPENYLVELVSDGLGNEGALGVAVDETDVFFISRRGFHSQQATDTYGDTDSAYLSADIKPTFTQWEQSKLKFTQGAYIPELNSVAFSVTEQGQQSQNAVWLYNVETQVPGKEKPGVWYRWPNVSCTSLSRRFTNGKYRLVFGTADGRLIQAQVDNSFSDFGTVGIPFYTKSGIIYPNNDPQSLKAFKKISMIYRPKGNFAFTVKATIDNLKAQAWSFNQISGLDLLGETFIMGNSILGSSATLAPFTFTMEGIGRGIILEISQPSADEQIEVWGFVIEYENADVEQATAD